MKKLFTLFALTAVLGASAQYAPLNPGTIATYTMKMTDPENKDSVEIKMTDRVLSTNADDKGIIEIVTESVSTAKDKTVTDTASVYYNPADKSTLIPMENAEDSKKGVIENIKAMAQEAGKVLSSMDLEDLDRQISARGDISITLFDDMAEGTKLPKKSLKINIGEQMVTTNLWEGLCHGKETVTTPAGTFECLKITYVYRTTAPQASQRMTVTNWFAPEIGLVRSTGTDKKGNVLLDQILTGIQKH